MNAVYVDTIPMQRGCYSNPEVMATDVVIVELKRECREEFFHQSTDQGCLAGCCTTVYMYENRIVKLRFTHCANAEEFVEAVKQQLQSLQ